MQAPVNYYNLLIPLMIFLIIYVMRVESSMHSEDGLEILFRERSQSDWEDVWHRETFSRCRDKLMRQLYWACEKDIYRLTRRNRKRADNESIQKRNDVDDMPKWLHFGLANTLLRTRRADVPSITSECCTKIGCTWEEYAEYCPSNKRRNHY